jgi:hypothetical protein
MIFYLPNINCDFETFDCLAGLAGVAAQDQSPKMELNFSLQQWFDANMAAPLGAVLTRLRTFKPVTVGGLGNPVKRILRKNRFLKEFGLRALPDSYQTTLHYQNIGLSETDRFADYLMTHLPIEGRPGMTTELTLTLQQSLFEIFSNAVTHSESPTGIFICGQFYPNKHRVHLSIADAGIGIPQKVNVWFAQILAQREDLRAALQKSKLLDENLNLPPMLALVWALKEGSTTKTGKLPGGAGLKVVKEFIARNRGRLQIASGGAFWEFCDGRETLKEFQCPFPGTVVNLEVRLAAEQSDCVEPTMQVTLHS